MSKTQITILSIILLSVTLFAQPDPSIKSAGEGKQLYYKGTDMESKIKKSADEWKVVLTPEQFRILRQKGTERAFTGKLNDHYEIGEYTCAGCGLELFRSDRKYNSGSGWPSFWDAISTDRIGTREDTSNGMNRIEVFCNHCGGHLGHLFQDGSQPTGQRYCINSAALGFVPGAETKTDDQQP